MWPASYSGAMSTARPRDELLSLFDEQVAFLERSNALFDQGHLIEAKLLALRLRVIFHQTRHSHALVNQLGLERILSWVDTAGVPDPENVWWTSGLTMLSFTDGQTPPEHVPLLGNGPPRAIRTRSGQAIATGSRVPFDDWWTNTVVKDFSGTEFSRRSLVLALSNKDGGAHIDPVADADYEFLAKSNSLGWAVTDHGHAPLTQNPVFPAMRQISFEVLESIRQQRELIR